jgi:hypothetical protein
MIQLRLAAAGIAAATLVTCGPPDHRTLLAQTWTCAMTTVTGDLTSDYRETVTFRPSGEYQTRATIIATKPDLRATMNMEWSGRWQLSADTFVRDFIGIKAVSGDYSGIPMTQDRLDAAADAFRSAPASERGKVITLNATQFVIETSTTPLSCKR